MLQHQIDRIVRLILLRFKVPREIRDSIVLATRTYNERNEIENFYFDHSKIYTNDDQNNKIAIRYPDLKIDAPPPQYLRFNPRDPVPPFRIGDLRRDNYILEKYPELDKNAFNMYAIPTKGLYELSMTHTIYSSAIVDIYTNSNTVMIGRTYDIVSDFRIDDPNNKIEKVSLEVGGYYRFDFIREFSSLILPIKLIPAAIYYQEARIIITWVDKETSIHLQYNAWFVDNPYRRILTKQKFYIDNNFYVHEGCLMRN